MAKGRKRPASDMDDRSISAQQQGTPNTGGGDAQATGAAAAAAAALGGTSSTSADEVRFGKHLASSDKKVRDRTVLALREWLQRRSKGGALSDLDLLKIWRGLWYCMFMCDKAPIQRELAQNLAGLVNLFKDDRAEGVRFFRSFCVTMQRDWERIDNLRIDKYYTLVRLCLREAIAFCRLPGKKTPDTSPKPPSNKKQKKRRKANVSSSSLEEMEVGPGAEPAAATWDVELLRAMSGVMEEEVVTLYPAAIGLRLHLADVWTEEAFVAGGEDMPTEAFLVAVAPWLRSSVAPETNPVVFKRTFEGVLEGLLGYFPKLNEGMEEGDGDGDEGGKKFFKLVELSKVQACLFEAAAAPQTRPKRRTQLYQLHRQYQQRTGVAPDASAPPSGLIPPPPVESEESDSDDSEGGEYVEAGQRPRAVRGPEPAVVGWVAAGMEAGVIRGDGEVAPKKKRKGDGEVKAKKSPKKIKEDGDALGEEEEAGTPAAAAAAVVDGSSSVKKSKKKRKSESLLNGKDGFADDDDADAGEATVVGVAEESSSVERKRKKKRKGRKDDDGDDDNVSGGIGISIGSGVCSGDGGGESSADDGTPAKKKTKKKAVSPGEDAVTSSADDATSAKKKSKNDRSEAEDTAVEKLSSQPSSGKKTKSKQKRTKSSPGVVVTAGTDTMSPVPVNEKNAFSEMPPPPTPTAAGVASFKTPPKGARSPRKIPGSEGSARKTVTFGHDMFKEHAKSMKDVKTCEVTPAKDSGTPRKGLLKVGGGTGSGKKAPGGKGSTPRRSKRAADFF